MQHLFLPAAVQAQEAKLVLKEVFNFLVLREIYLLIQMIFHDTTPQNEYHSLRFH